MNIKVTTFTVSEKSNNTHGYCNQAIHHMLANSVHTHAAAAAYHQGMHKIKAIFRGSNKWSEIVTSVSAQKILKDL